MYEYPPPQKKSILEQHIDHLNAQHKHLLVLQRYLRWDSHSFDPEIALKYRELADLLVEAADQYTSIVNILQSQLDHE